MSITFDTLYANVFRRVTGQYDDARAVGHRVLADLQAQLLERFSLGRDTAIWSATYEPDTPVRLEGIYRLGLEVIDKHTATIELTIPGELAFGTLIYTAAIVDDHPQPGQLTYRPSGGKTTKIDDIGAFLKVLDGYKQSLTDNATRARIVHSIGRFA